MSGTPSGCFGCLRAWQMPVEVWTIESNFWSRPVRYWVLRPRWWYRPDLHCLQQSLKSNPDTQTHNTGLSQTYLLSKAEKVAMVNNLFLFSTYNGSWIRPKKQTFQTTSSRRYENFQNSETPSFCSCVNKANSSHSGTCWWDSLRNPFLCQHKEPTYVYASRSPLTVLHSI